MLPAPLERSSTAVLKLNNKTKFHIREMTDIREKVTQQRALGDPSKVVAVHIMPALEDKEGSTRDS